MLVANASFVFKDAGSIQQKEEVENISEDTLCCKLVRLWRDGVKEEGRMEWVTYLHSDAMLGNRRTGGQRNQVYRRSSAAYGSAVVTTIR